MRLAARALLVAFLGSTSTCCARQASGETEPVATRETPSLEATPKPPVEPKTQADWVEPVRMEMWEEASRLLSKAPEEELAKPGLRYLRAKIALVRDDAATALSLLEGLEKELPEVEETIRELRLEAMIHAGPHEEAGRVLEAKGSLEALIGAALAYEKAERLEEAKRVAGRAIARAKSTADQARARLVRARAAEALGEKTLAISDARWLAISAPDADDDAGRKMLARLAPDRPLTVNERTERATNLAAGGKVDLALEELSSLASLKNAPPREELAWTRGQILYRARRYSAAAREFDVAKRRGKRQAQASLLAARARSRADYDDEAAKGYRELIKRFPKSPEAEEARYLLARLRYLHGQWASAASALDDYLRRHPKGRFRQSARYERAVSLLAAKRHREAARELSQLARAEKGHEAARLRALQAVALANAGDRKGAIAIFTEVASSQPLMFAGLVARARLASLGAELPPLIEPADAQNEPEPIAVSLPETASFFQSLGLDGEAEAWLRDREGEWATGPHRGQTLCRLYGELGRATRRYRVGVAHVPERLVMRAPSPASSWAWDCLYPRPYAAFVEQVTEREGLPPGLVHAVMRIESAFNPNAISRARAMGLLQLMPRTARNVAEEHGIPYDEKLVTSPPVNIDLGARYLAKMRETFHGSIPLAAAAYNAGPHAVARWLDRSDGLSLDVFVARIPFRETRGYVQRVVSNYARYALLEGGEEAVPSLDLALPKPIKVSADAY